MDPGWFFFGLSDPYVVVTLLSATNPSFQTKSIDHCLDPVWNSAFALSGFIPGTALKLEVFDREDWPKSPQFMGKAVLESAEFYPSGFDGDIPLDGGGNLTARVSAVDHS